MKYDRATLMRSQNRLEREDFVFFWGHTDRKDRIGKQCLSQWYPCQFMMHGLRYNCAEQFMMAEKARMFGDEDTWNQIMAAHDPMTAKKLGRRVRNFNEYVWRCNRFDVVMTANLAKFSQNDKLREFLLSTGDKILVEASPKDTVWGIGLAEDAPEACNPKLWQGENLLGFALMKVRDILRNEDVEEEPDFSGALSMWTMGAGNSARRFNMEDPMPAKQEMATAESWTTEPLEVYKSVLQDYYITSEQMAVIRYGHIPDAMEDHWFMYCDDRAIRYYRSWTGICFAQAFYEPCGDGFRITELRINNNLEEFRLKDFRGAIALFYALLISEYGGNSGPYWNAAF